MGMRTWWVAAGFALAVGCGSSESDDVADVPDVLQLDFTEFDKAVDDFVQAEGLQGASAAIVHKDMGLVHVTGYGAYEAERIYAIASSSKVLSVGVIMRLADQGLLDVDAPIGTYLGEFGDGRSALTLAQLVSNSSGLVSLTDNPFYAPYLCQYMSGGTLTECAEKIYTAADDGAGVAADTEFHYGGGQWQLAGGVAEVVSGKSWAELVDETYRQPCSVDALGYTNQFERAALGYPTFFEADPALLPMTDNPSVEGGAYIDVEDYATLLLMHLRGGVCEGGRVLSEDAVARMQEDRIGDVYSGSTTSAELAGYGLGWWVDREDSVVVDPGAYGAVAALDLGRGYGLFFAIESTSEKGLVLYNQLKPILDAQFESP